MMERKRERESEREREKESVLAMSPHLSLRLSV